MLSTWQALTTGKHFVSYSLLFYQLLENIGYLGTDRKNQWKPSWIYSGNQYKQLRIYGRTRANSAFKTISLKWVNCGRTLPGEVDVGTTEVKVEGGDKEHTELLKNQREKILLTLKTYII